MAERADAVTKARVAGPGTVIVVNVDIEEGDEGLLYATSPDLKGLFVAASSIDELEAEVPRVIKIMLEKASGRGQWDVRPASRGSEPAHITHMWAAVPPHVASAALGNEGTRRRAR